MLGFSKGIIPFDRGFRGRSPLDGLDYRSLLLLKLLFAAHSAACRGAQGKLFPLAGVLRGRSPLSGLIIEKITTNAEVLNKCQGSLLLKLLIAAHSVACRGVQGKSFPLAGVLGDGVS